ncbi:DUF1345 domain-containing protein [Streptosporangiaceae bacterium NEAU-GS5]|nr:DUF1345 domain-containing protein [Streptosporangiaceae bacterium NEAU-GS5]
MREGEAEGRWPAVAATLVIVGLHLWLSEQQSIGLAKVMPVVETGLLIALIAANPVRMRRENPLIRSISLGLLAAIGLANAWIVIQEADALIRGTEHDPLRMLSVGGGVWLINVLLFALWYWEFDRGGPVARRQAREPYPDFAFAQMSAPPKLVHPKWKPSFVDYLYLAFTNATAFSPTDVMPMTVRAKLAMLVQSTLSVIIVVLVIARAVNVLT